MSKTSHKSRHPGTEADEVRREAEQSEEAIQNFADRLRDGSGGLYLRGISIGSALAAAPIESIDKYVQEFLEDTIGCSPKHEPLLRTLAEQVILAHHTIGRLQCEALASKDTEARRANMQLAISLTGELRRLTKDLAERAELSRNGKGLQVVSESEKMGGQKRTG